MEQVPPENPKPPKTPTGGEPGPQQESREKAARKEGSGRGRKGKGKGSDGVVERDPPSDPVKGGKQT